MRAWLKGGSQPDPTRLNLARLLELANWHGLLPVLSEVCPALGPEFQLYAQAQAFRNRLLAEELLRLLERFEYRGIPSLVLKGPLLAEWLYGGVGMRAFGDLDVLVEFHQAPAARTALEEAGYIPDHPGAEPTGYHWRFARGGETAVVELHWGFSTREFYFPLEPREVWRHRRTYPLLGRAVEGLGLEHQLLTLAVHGARHLWKRIFWLLDLALLLRRGEPFDSDYLLYQAKRLRSRRMLALGMALVQQILQVPSPGFPAYPRLEGLVRQVERDWLEGRIGPPTLPERHCFYYQVREDPRDRAQVLRLLLRAVTTPTLEEQARWPLPPRLRFLYRVLKPVWLLRRILPR